MRKIRNKKRYMRWFFGRLLVMLLMLAILICVVYAVWVAVHPDDEEIVQADTVTHSPVANMEQKSLQAELPTEEVSAAAEIDADAEDENATQPDDEPITAPILASARDVELIARTMWGEAVGVKNADGEAATAEQAAVGWCILNRVDRRGQSIEDVILQPNQFWCITWDDDIPKTMYWLALDVVSRWEREHAGCEDVGRTLPPEYEYFTGDGKRNYFTIEWQGTDYWDWSLPDPYTEGDAK